ncbi:DUF427 domain-containing protein [Belnapia sp. T18]|uniref:DUF427 domain-containing protein n=1 Tax=Belnapia arida TaxID=2804533 RepID=A0ABS1UBU2_9PROT|nr:DUF427 domain-containing protein [Belnapia arida]MBL6082157.1 DUF427 domain-containing protein [Belnapia arida]
MTGRKLRIPDASHPIAIERDGASVVVHKDATVIARTRSALTLSEASYPPAQYIPQGDFDMSLLERSAHTTYCRYKGEANYYSIRFLGEAGLNAVWTYEAPFEAVGENAGHLAFYPDRVLIEVGE